MPDKESSDSGTGVSVSMLPRDRTKCVIVSDIISVQCVIIIVGSATILCCVWTPDLDASDFDKLLRIMYLFDSQVCGYKLMTSKNDTNLRLSNNTKGCSGIRPIQWRSPSNAVSTRLSFKTRRYIEISLSVHCIWLVLSIVSRIFLRKSTALRSLKIVLAVFFYSAAMMLAFDTSMALVYISHIKQSLTKGMILRYSGWSGTLKLDAPDEFGGWLPITGSCFWLRGVLLFFVNIYCTRVIKKVRSKIRRREIKKKYENERYVVIPEPTSTYFAANVVVYHDGPTRL